MPLFSRSLRAIRKYAGVLLGGLLPVLLPAASGPSAATLPEPPRQKQPAWVRDEGLAMAANWESFYYLNRRHDVGPDDDMADRRAAFDRGFTEETARRLKDFGITFVMLPLYKGFGLETERPQMEQTKEFTAVCHRLGLRVGVYVFSGTLFYESALTEDPGAEEWFERGPDGQYLFYNWSDARMYYRRYVNRDHPGVRAQMRKLVQYAVEEAKVDLIHLDNYHDGPGYNAYSVKRFREFLAGKYSPEERRRRFGFSSVDHIEPPLKPGADARWVSDPLIQDFIDYRATIQADTYRELAEYARSLNPEIVMECNPGGYNEKTPDPSTMPANDYFRLLPLGGAFWHEGYPSHIEKDGRLNSRFRSDMMGRQFNNMVFQFTYERAGLAESLANTLQAGCCLSFESGDLRAPQGRDRALDPAVKDYLRFYHAHPEFYRDAEPITDVGVLNTFENNVYGPFDSRRHAATFEQSLYQGRIPFTLVPGRYAGDLTRFRALVLSDLHFLEPSLVRAVRAYVEAGGGLVLTGNARGFSDLFPTPPTNGAQRVNAGRGRVVYLPEVKLPMPFGLPAVNHDELIDAVRWAAGGSFTVDVTAPMTTALAFYQQSGGGRLLHLVNYDSEHALTDVVVTLETPASKITVYSPDEPEPVVIHVERPTRTFRVPRLSTYVVVALQ